MQGGNGGIKQRCAYIERGRGEGMAGKSVPRELSMCFNYEKVKNIG